LGKNASEILRLLVDILRNVSLLELAVISKSREKSNLLGENGKAKKKSLRS